MNFVAFGLVTILCISILIYTIKVYRKDKKAMQEEGYPFKEDNAQ